jgi:hypothetical protein
MIKIALIIQSYQKDIQYINFETETEKDKQVHLLFATMAAYKHLLPG